MKKRVFLGTVSTGCGKASEIPDKNHQERCTKTNLPLVRGTLNLDVDSVPETLTLLGDPKFLTEPGGPKGAVRWWPVLLAFEQWPASRFCAFVVRLEHSATRYCEIMAPTCFKELGVKDGDLVQVYIGGWAG